MTAGSNILGSFSVFCYKFCEQVNTGANVLRFLVYHIIDFVQKLLGNQLLYFLLVSFIIDLCANDCEAAMLSRVTASWSGMRGVLAVCLIFSLILPK